MTIREKMEQLCVERGLFSGEAKIVVSAYESNTKEMQNGTMDKNMAGYPVTFVAGVFAGVKFEALRWIDANKPKLWARPMFTPFPEKTIAEMEANERPKP
jgi:hypothetical protein